MVSCIHIQFSTQHQSIQLRTSCEAVESAKANAAPWHGKLHRIRSGWDVVGCGGNQASPGTPRNDSGIANQKSVGWVVLVCSKGMLENS